MLLNWILASGSWSKATYGSHKYLLSWPNVCLSRRIRQLIIRSGRFDPPVYGHKVRPGAVVFSQHGRKIIGFQINWFTNGNDGLGQTGVQLKLMTVFGRAALTPGRMTASVCNDGSLFLGMDSSFFGGQPELYTLLWILMHQMYLKQVHKFHSNILECAKLKCLNKFYGSICSRLSNKFAQQVEHLAREQCPNLSLGVYHLCSDLANREPYKRICSEHKPCLPAIICRAFCGHFLCRPQVDKFIINVLKFG